MTDVNLDQEIRATLAAWTGNTTTVYLVRALTAVLDLHSPTQGQGFRSENFDYDLIEEACFSCGHSDEYAVEWPCPTILAIATALGTPDD